MNRAQAYIWDGKRDEGLKILAAEDWSAANDEFQVCVAALRQDVGAAIRYMRSIGAKSRPGKEGYRDWPVFRELRRSEDFLIAFSELFGEPFAWTVKENVPLCVGVPEMTPFEPSVRPAGSVPEASDHELTVPPEAVSAGDVYAWPSAASGRDGVVTTRR